MSKILCSIATYGRYFTTLPMTIMAVANQTRLPDKLVIFDDNDEPQDMRKESIYQNIFFVLDSKGIAWEWLFAGKKGQHHIHQAANCMGYDWVWRVDDDAIPEANVLENLSKYCADDVGGVGGSVLNPPQKPTVLGSTGLIANLRKEPNIQWGLIAAEQQVEHLYQSFLYRAGVHDYNLGLSRIAHGEETLFTYGLHRKGYKLLAVPNAISWHLKNPDGGIRTHAKQQMFESDDRIFNNFLEYNDKTIVVLNCGLGDHIVFTKVIDRIKNPAVFTCYPDVIPGESIEKAIELFGSIEQWNIYRKMDQWKWTQSLQAAFERLYL